MLSTGVTEASQPARAEKKRRSADDQIIDGPDQEWEKKALASSSGEQLGRDSSGRSARLRQRADSQTGQVNSQYAATTAECQRKSTEVDMSDDPTVKTSNLQSSRAAERKRQKKLRKKQQKMQTRAEDADLQMLDEQVKAMAPEREQHKRQKEKSRKKARRRKAKTKCREKADAEPSAESSAPETKDVRSTCEVHAPGNMSEDDQFDHVFGVVLTQFSLKRGLAEFGEKGERSAMKEMKQFQDYGCISPVDPSTLSAEEKKRAVRSFMFLKEKRDGEKKSRAVANGSVQRAYINKEDASSPTPNVDSIFITAAIDAYERRHVAQFDIPGAFLHTDSDEDVTMILEGPLAEIMAKIDPQVYRKHITKNGKGKAVLYVKCHKAVYGLLRSVLLFFGKTQANSA